VKESFLHQLLQGYLHAYSEEDLQERMRRYKWQLDGRQFIVMYMQMSGIASMEGKFRSGDEGLATFAAVNMIEELAAEHFEQHNAVNFHNLAVGLLIVAPKDGEYEEALKAFSAELTASINMLLKMRLTIAISRPTAKLSTVPLYFEEAKVAAGYRSLESDNQIIGLEERGIQSEGAAEHAYPFTLEREFIQALRTGREQDAQSLLHAFMEALSCTGAKQIDVQQGMLHLLGSVLHAVMSSGISPNVLYKGENMYERLSQIREPKLQLSWFQKRIVAPFMQELASRSDAGTKRLIESAMIYLGQNYMYDISLDNCADHIGTNPFYLSKAFKSVTGVNFIDYLTNLRMEKAKELLRESALKINDVAEQVGYQHSYFNRIFKRIEGMTPSRYRELSQAE